MKFAALHFKLDSALQFTFVGPPSPNIMRVESNAFWRWALLALLNAPAFAPCFAEEEPQQLTVDSEVAKVAEGLTGAASSRLLRQAAYQTDVAPSGLTTPASATYESISGNVWGIGTVQKMKNGLIQTRTVSLCGLVDLVSASTSVMQFDNAVPVPVGPVFIPMGMHVTKTFASRTRAASLAVPEESTNLCAPQAGSSFAYSVRTETELPQAPAGSPKVLSNSFEWRCTAGALTNAGALDAVWSGGYIPVTCNSTNAATGKPLAANYVYLVDVGFYLKLGTFSDPLQIKTRYSSIDSAPR